jgi:hypothetical protein
MCVPRIQYEECVFQEYNTKNVCFKNTKQRMCVRRIQKGICSKNKNKERVFQEYKANNVCSKNTKTRTCVSRIQDKECVFQEYKKECVFQEYNTKNVCYKNTKTRTCVPRIKTKNKTKECVFQKYKIKNVCSTNTKQRMCVPIIQKNYYCRKGLICLCMEQTRICFRSGTKKSYKQNSEAFTFYSVEVPSVRQSGYSYQLIKLTMYTFKII